MFMFVVARLLTEILEKADSNVIQFLQDGSWEPIPEHEKSNGKSSSSALSSPSPMVHMIGGRFHK